MKSQFTSSGKRDKFDLRNQRNEIPSDEIVVFEANPASNESSVKSLEVEESMRDLNLAADEFNSEY